MWQNRISCYAVLFFLCSCVPLRQACYDQGSFVVFGTAHDPQQGGKAPLKALQLGNNHLDFRDFGDVIGIMQVTQMTRMTQVTP